MKSECEETYSNDLTEFFCVCFKKKDVMCITTRGADYAHHITASPPGFENPAASLYIEQIDRRKIHPALLSNFITFLN